MIVDVSHWKPITNWSLAKKGAEFLISKATQGTNYIDPYLDNFVANCEANNIPYWLYVFLDKGNEIAQTNFPMGANNPAINPPKAKPPQTNPCVMLAMLKIAPVETPLTVPPFTPPYLAHKSTIITAIILPRDMFS